MVRHIFLRGDTGSDLASERRCVDHEAQVRAPRATALLLALACSPVMAAGAGNCAARNGVQFICGVGAIEDLAPVPDTPWLLAGGMRLGEPVSIRAIDARTNSLSVVWPGAGAVRADTTDYPQCPGPPDTARLSTTGVALQPRADGPGLFYAVNQGDRRAVEVFEVRLADAPTAAQPPRLTWVGCIPMPDGTNPNAVTPLAGRAVAIVSMDDGSPNRMTRHVAGEALGSVWTWRPEEGLRRLPGPGLRGGNGIAASADHRWLYVSEWAGGRILRIALDGSAPPRASDVPFLPDNLKLAPDGSLLMGAQRPPLRTVALCQGSSCPADWNVTRIDPATMRRNVLRGASGNAQVNYATGAVEHEGRIWITSRGDGRIIVLPAPGR